MNRLNGKRREVLDACLSHESPEVRARVYEIIDVSGLDADDPMFLILALTGQIKVFLESAPADLSKLLAEWKEHNARSLDEIYAAISLIEQTKERQAETIARNLQQVTSQCVSDFKQAGMATTSAISEANSETLEQVRQAKLEASNFKHEIIALRTLVKSERQDNLEQMNTFVGYSRETTKLLATMETRTHQTLSEMKKIQQRTAWLKVAEFLYSYPVLIAYGLFWIGITWFIASKRYNHPHNVLGRDLVDWNVERINHCRQTENPKCTFWIVPPGSPERQQ